MCYRRYNFCSSANFQAASFPEYSLCVEFTMCVLYIQSTYRRCLVYEQVWLAKSFEA